MDAEEKARIEAEMAEKLEALALMENEKREKDEELERIRLQVHTNAFSFPQNNIVLTTKSVVLRKHRIIWFINGQYKQWPKQQREITLFSMSSFYVRNA